NYAFSLVPREISTGLDVVGSQIVQDSLGNVGRVQHYPTPLPVYFNFLSSMFMHGGFMHLFGNMLFLWVFGDNLEDRLGHIRYAVFYLVCGFAAALAQIVMDTNSIIPMLGASGAISGVLGGYLLLFPHRRVTALIFNFLMQVPAYVALGIWIAYQLILGYMTDPGTGGVAYAAHIGGFIAGVVLIKFFAIGTGGDLAQRRL
ncbi:MAG: rhomboid family intramembrane serine protease, partial [Acidobacteriota bacterium]|nr:rhomboid family intramembrane serine protease [Acidobacteriota bacterium]